MDEDKTLLGNDGELQQPRTLRKKKLKDRTRTLIQVLFTGLFAAFVTTFAIWRLGIFETKSVVSVPQNNTYAITPCPASVGVEQRDYEATHQPIFSHFDSVDYSISPDGQFIVYTKDGDIFKANLNGANKRNLTPATQDTVEHHPVWSPDGNHILFSVNEEHATKVYLSVMNSDGSGRHRLTDGNEDYIGQWSPDGKLIAFNSGRDHTQGIYLANTDGSNVRTLSKGAGDEVPRFSPDGKIIIFNSGRTGTGHLYIMDLGGQNQRRLTTQFNHEDGAAKWTSDGRYIVFAADQGIYAVEYWPLSWANTEGHACQVSSGFQR